jgi:hypothetical protein
METLILKKSPSFTNKLSSAEGNFSGTYDDIRIQDDTRSYNGKYKYNSETELDGSVLK